MSLFFSSVVSKCHCSCLCVRVQCFTNCDIKAIYSKMSLWKLCALIKTNSVTVGVEWPRPRMLNIFSSPEYVAGDWMIQYRLSVRLKGNMTIGRFNLIPRRVDIFEIATFHQLYYKSKVRFTEQQLDPGVRTEVIFVRTPCFSNLTIKSIYSL
jgi:hypothetical protein